jgi:hypothetical protein
MQRSFQEGNRKKRRTTTIATQSKTRADNSPGSCEGTSRVGYTHILPSPLETWELLPLTFVCNPYYKHFGAR